MAFQADSIFWVEIEKIVPNPFQPRREFDESKLKELAESVRMYGILQPLTVTRKEIQNGDGSFRSEYELIAGERRLRASKLAGLQIVPVIIRDGEQTEQEKLELAIIENLQREDLNAVDRALAFRQLADVFGLSHAQVAQKVGRSREYVSNSIRLLALPDYMLDALRVNDMTEGHARTLLMLNDRPEEQDVVFREILLKKLSVREVEKIARGIATEKVRKKELVDNNLLEIEKEFTDALGTRVSITKTEFGGRLTIDYFSVEDLEAMLVRMKSEGSLTPSIVSDEYRDESKDTVVSEVVDEEMATLAELARATGIEPVIPNYINEETVNEVVLNEVAVSGLELEIDNGVTEEDPVLMDDMVELDVLPVDLAEETPDYVLDTEAKVVEPVVSAAPVTPVVTAPKPTLSLRDQLAALLSKKPESHAVESASTMQPVTNIANAAHPPIEVSKKATPDNDDDTNLYSMNSFTI